MTAAVFTLIGVALGGAITFGSQWLFERTRTAREDRREDQLALGAARLLQQDFRRALLRLHEAAQTRTWWRADAELIFRVTMDDRRALAARLPTDGWATIVIAESDFENWNENRLDAPARELSVEAARSLRHSAGLLEQALTVLLDYERAEGRSSSSASRANIRSPHPAARKKPRMLTKIQMDKAAISRAVTEAGNAAVAQLSSAASRAARAVVCRVHHQQATVTTRRDGSGVRIVIADCCCEDLQHRAVAPAIAPSPTEADDCLVSPLLRPAIGSQGGSRQAPRST